MKTTEEMTPYLEIIRNSQLFQGIYEKDLRKAIQFLNGTVHIYEKEELLLALGSPFTHSGIVLEGTVEGSFVSENYNKINMNHFPAGKSFGEALAAAEEKHSPIQLRALTDCTVLLLNLRNLVLADFLPEPYQQRLSLNLIHILATQSVFTHLKLRITTQRSIRDRVLMYLYSMSPDENGFYHIPFTQTALAEFLGVNRSALARELGHMQDEGILLVDGKRMKILT